jgi:activator of HSP90 ATPase
MASHLIHQEILLNATPDLVYDALLNSDKFTRFTGGRSADISREVGGRFTLFDGRIIGRNVELVFDRRIVQAWRSSTWGEGIYSIVRFELERLDSGLTRLRLDHSGFPEDQWEHLETGWHANYWLPLQSYL